MTFALHIKKKIVNKLLQILRGIDLKSFYKNKKQKGNRYYRFEGEKWNCVGWGRFNNLKQRLELLSEFLALNKSICLKLEYGTSI